MATKSRSAALSCRLFLMLTPSLLATGASALSPMTRETNCRLPPAKCRIVYRELENENRHQRNVYWQLARYRNPSRATAGADQAAQEYSNRRISVLPDDIGFEYARFRRCSIYARYFRAAGRYPDDHWKTFCR